MIELNFASVLEMAQFHILTTVSWFHMLAKQKISQSSIPKSGKHKKLSETETQKTERLVWYQQNFHSVPLHCTHQRETRETALSFTSTQILESRIDSGFDSWPIEFKKK